MMNVHDTTGHGPIPVFKNLCGNLGVYYSSQMQRIKRHGWPGMFMMNIRDTNGRTQEPCVITRKLMSYWMATLEASRGRPGKRGKLMRYQEEAAEALDRHFFGEARPQAVAPSRRLRLWGWPRP